MGSERLNSDAHKGSHPSIWGAAMEQGEHTPQQPPSPGQMLWGFKTATGRQTHAVVAGVSQEEEGCHMAAKRSCQDQQTGSSFPSSQEGGWQAGKSCKLCKQLCG